MLLYYVIKASAQHGAHLLDYVMAEINKCHVGLLSGAFGPVIMMQFLQLLILGCDC